MATFYPKGARIRRWELENGAYLNPHGHGWAVVGERKGQVMCDKSLNADLEIDIFSVFREEFPDAPAMFHSRFASVTEHTPEDAHPFVVGGDRETLMIHNGYLFTSPDGRSDSRVLAEDILPRWDLTDLDQCKELADLIAPSKVVVLSTRHEPVILNKHLGVTLDDGTWHSNTDYTGVTLSPPAGHCRLCRDVSELAVCVGCQVEAEARRELLLG